MSRTIMDILQRQREAIWERESWCVPLAKALQDVTSAQAAWQPEGGGNSIWQTLNHMNFYNERIHSRLAGNLPPEMDTNTATFGEAGDPADEAGWKAAVDQAYTLAEQLKVELSQLTDSDLERPFTKESNIGQEIPMWLIHDSFHTGQIVLLRKQQGIWPETREEFG
ncbi:hypothetical protein SY83_10405 [Paenibacillus swuensis]|uniref:DinB-like domain-containing protein n=1 Tax=Paenibacillus swuensis TaxID=1178515 RepID=A0A172TIJ4_9BACL|nr:DinB family protein [Paenibacillus swuensis]ANE46613.1 hypothetical protein SY83_10405 [Paenibacillus swuensis]